MEPYCQNPNCENKAVKEVPVSVRKPGDETRALCAVCEEAYSWGVQHGTFTAELENESEVRMLNKMREAIGQVLEGLDVGGEQSRQFAEEIKTLKDVLGYQQPPEDGLAVVRRRSRIVDKLRALAVEARGLEVSLPTRPVAQWLNGTVQDATVDVYFKKHDLSELLRFIADVGIDS